MMWIALVLTALLGLALIALTRTRRRPAAAIRSEVQSMRTTLERKVREGADFRF